MKRLILAIPLLAVCSQSVHAAPDEKTTTPKHPKHQTSLTKETLKKIFTTASDNDIDTFYNDFQYSYYFNIKSKQNEDMYLATVLTEIGTDLIGVRENLNYSCSALPNMFGYYSRNGGYNEDGRCDDHQANQEAIGNKAYSDRIGNGDVASGDGYRFRGGGYAQTTGRYNYQVIVDAVNKLLNKSHTAEEFADDIEKTHIANLGGMGYWYQVNASECDTMNCVTTKWNKSTDTYDERESNYNFIKNL